MQLNRYGAKILQIPMAMASAITTSPAKVREVALDKMGIFQMRMAMGFVITSSPVKAKGTAPGKTEILWMPMRTASVTTMLPVSAGETAPGAALRADSGTAGEADATDNFLN